MSLRVWLPLNGDLTNNGLSDVSITNSSTVTNANGKLGRCYYFNGNSSYLKSTDYANLGDTFSICAWVKLIGDSRSDGLFCDRSATYGGFTIYFYNGIITIDPSAPAYSTSTRWTTNVKLNANTWYHIAVIRTSTSINVYVDGRLQASKDVAFANSFGNCFTIGGFNTNGVSMGTMFYGYMNDFRIYDHALSPKEVKLLSQGLVCHYKLSDKLVQQMDNCYAYPTFNTSVATGGWYHWGASGHIGTYGQNTDKQYIYNKENMYSHWVADGEDATQDYLVYQMPAFEGGYRSLVCILKEENGTKIDETIIYPAWNSDDPSSGVAQHKWTSIQHLHDGFYLCKVDGFKQTGSNDLVGLYIVKGHKVYISECYLENDKQVNSDIFYNTNIIYDSSGYNNHAQIWNYDEYGDIEVIHDTTRNSIATYINSENVTTNTASGTWMIYGKCGLTTPSYLTIAFWCKPFQGYSSSVGNGQFCTTNNVIGLGAGTDYNTTAMHNRDGGIDFYSSTSIKKRVGITFTANEWHHYAVVYDGRYGRVYKDGIETGNVDFESIVSLTSFSAIVIGYSHAGGAIRSNKSYYSDFRLYATALSQEDIQQLYNTPVSVANTGAMLTQGEFVEVTT